MSSTDGRGGKREMKDRGAGRTAEGAWFVGKAPAQAGHHMCTRTPTTEDEMNQSDRVRCRVREHMDALSKPQQRRLRPRAVSALGRDRRVTERGEGLRQGSQSRTPPFGTCPPPLPARAELHAGWNKNGGMGVEQSPSRAHSMGARAGYGRRRKAGGRSVGAAAPPWSRCASQSHRSRHHYRCGAVLPAARQCRPRKREQVLQSHQWRTTPPSPHSAPRLTEVTTHIRGGGTAAVAMGSLPTRAVSASCMVWSAPVVVP